MSEDKQEEYLQEVQSQILAILNQVKEELGVDTPIEIEIREAEDE